MITNNDFGGSKTFPQKAAVLFDGSYWEKIRQELGFLNVDLDKLSDEISKPAYRLRTYYFDGKHTDRQSFHDGLTFIPRFEVVLGDVVEKTIECPHCKRTITTLQQKLVDVQLAVRMVHLATSRQVDMIVLIAGDRDFIPSVEIAKYAGVLIRLVHGSKRHTSTALRQLADETVELTANYLHNFIREHGDKRTSTRVVRTIMAQKPAANITDEIKFEVKKLLTEAISKVSLDGEQEVLGSKLGIAISNIEPNWKKKFNVKKLVDLIKIGGKGLLVPKFVGNVLYFDIVNNNLKQRPIIDTTAKKRNTALKFLSDTLEELERLVKSKKIPLARIGIALSQKDPSWKKKYRIKKLDNLIKLAEDKEILRRVMIGNTHGVEIL